jgi:hypothetical protein
MHVSDIQQYSYPLLFKEGWRGIKSKYKNNANSAPGRLIEFKGLKFKPTKVRFKPY